MRIAFILSFIANIALTITVLIIGPSEMAIHFGFEGEPDSWAPAYVNAIIMTTVELLIFLCILFTPQLLRVVPPKFINLPNKYYWLREDRREQTSAVLSRHLFSFGTATFVLLFIVGLLALDANLSNPVRFREDLFWWPFGIYIAFTLFWTIRIIQAFQLPKEERS